jgi:hypothetical protein
MKVVKIVLGVVAALWAVAYFPKVFGDASQYGDLDSVTGWGQWLEF